MAYCTNCGKELPENADFCTECGASCKKNTPVPPENPYFCDGQNEPNPSYTPPMNKDTPPFKESRYAVPSMWEYFLYFFLMAIPVVGLIIAILWACGASKKQSCIHFARGYLIYTAISLVLSLICTLLFSMVTINIITELSNGLSNFYHLFESYSDIFFDIYEEYNGVLHENVLSNISTGFFHI